MSSPFYEDAVLEDSADYKSLEITSGSDFKAGTIFSERS